MSDRLYLSCWIRGFNGSNMLTHYAKLLDTFPFSRLTKRPEAVRVYAVEWAEPAAMEVVFEPRTEEQSKVSGASVVEAIREFMHEDCCCEFEGDWDLFDFQGEWKLAPSPVALLCMGPEFDGEANHDLGDHVRIEFGLDAKFLPMPNVPGSLRMQQSNLRSLLHLVKELERVLPLERRQLWSESGTNFAELLAQAVGQFDIQ